MNAMEPIGLIAMDMDGTLLTHRDDGPAYISPANLEALREAHKRGIRLVIASGRMPDDAGAFALEAGLPMAILSLNGACCQAEAMGEIVSSQLMPIDAGRRVWQQVTELGLEAGLFAGHTLLTTRPMRTEADLHRWGTYLTRPGTRCRVTDRPEDAEPMLASGVHKVVIISQDNPSLLADLHRELETTVPGIQITSSWVSNLQVNALGVNKGSGLRELADRLGIPMSRVMAIGDNGNDIPMLREAGFGVAMGNATPDTLAAADYVTRSVREDGVAHAIRRLAIDGHPEGGRSL